VRALIIGGSGFVGRNLASFLASRGAKLTVLDRSSDPLGGLDGVFLEGDAQDPRVVVDALEHASPDVVYHLAANSDISAGIADASLDFGDTLMTTIAVAQACQVHPIRELVFASSSAIFGITSQPISEHSQDFYQPVSWYGKAKLASEYVLQDFSNRNKDTSVLLVRFPNVVGPKATHGVVYDFLRKLRSDPSKLQVLGDGYQQKPYVHVTELVAGIEHFRTNMSACELDRINLGPSDTINVRSIVDEVLAATHIDAEVHYQDQPHGWIGDVPKYEFDTKKMQAGGFEIKKTSRQAIRAAIEDLLVEESIP